MLATDRALVAAWLLQLAGFMLLAGPRALEPGQERYALCLLAPAVVLAARAAAVLSMRSRRWQWLTLVTAALAAWFFLADYQQHYFRCFDETGGAAHKTFRTAVIEPKRAALDYIVKHREPGVTWIVTPAGRDGYWSYWPLRYLALAEHDIRVVMVDEAASQAELPRAWADGRVWFVRYDDDAPQWPAFVTAAPAGRGLHRQYICDNGGRSALVLLNAASATGSR